MKFYIIIHQLVQQFSLEPQSTRCIIMKKKKKNSNTYNKDASNIAYKAAKFIPKAVQDRAVLVPPSSVAQQRPINYKTPKSHHKSAMLTCNNQSTSSSSSFLFPCRSSRTNTFFAVQFGSSAEVVACATYYIKTWLLSARREFSQSRYCQIRSRNSKMLQLTYNLMNIHLIN